jgi:NAD(P)-dependent dehydrogenase (short-subunit alcohol dehydrogenase family)
VSVVAPKPFRFSIQNPCGLTKHTVEHMTMGMAAEVGDLEITVNCIAPGISAFEAASDQLLRVDGGAGAR